MMMLRGVRGATTADENTAEAILIATQELLQRLIDVNGIKEEEVASIIISTTPDLDTVYPARAARELGWADTALLGCQEAGVEGGLSRCIRILIHWNTTKSIMEIEHVYLRNAEILRPDRNKFVGD